MDPREAVVAVTELTGARAVAAYPLTDNVFEVDTDDGDLFVAKYDARTAAVTATAAGMDWLAEPGAVAVPQVRGADDRWLVMEQVEQSPWTPDAVAAFGRGLADLHSAGAPAFGASTGPERAWIGLAPLTCVPADTSWAAWYVTDRIEPYLRGAADRCLLDADGVHAVEQVCARVDDLAGPPEPPARLHGDLWHGNVLWTVERAWLIDPAAHGGHRETDLAMLSLFGCPELSRVLAAYHEHRPLADGWRARVPLHQLFPLLVHTVVFGGTYARQVADTARAALRA
ncbi:fructosamine kinase family protein [Actinokineospora auranticolor]|uniref:Fructosamine-3-kinase n=1 Tax=Actinokineospora auranticolor TaxID=155976 RepID=A0A2S6GDY6_9PSEU|nr:fructosamine kinase family protein [Actinokineospora auranticolor]PPK63420.1 fructosamine-3-kinase [Actinokineospora auranticolor]